MTAGRPAAKNTRGIAFRPGNPGKPKGAVSKNTKAIKDMILQALDGAGGAEYLERRANDPRTAAAFLGLIGKVLPLQIANEDGKTFAVTVIERRIVSAATKNTA